VADGAAHARLNGERAVGVDATGAIAVVVGIVGAPSPLWGDVLVGLEDRPSSVTRISARARDASPAEPPTQIELRVGSPGDLREALDWLVAAIERTNEHHREHQRRLAAIYQEALASVEDWYEEAQSSGAARQDPTRN
jgi:hypothetical protein